MKIEEFNNTGFGSGMKAIYDGDTYSVSSVNFKEALVAIVDLNDFDEPMWVRCENIDLV